MTKIITLVRHGNYSGRQLNELGKGQVSDIAAQMIRANAIPEVLVCSPLDRAQQTAVILKDAFKAAAGKDIPMKIFRWLHCDEAATDKNFAALDNDSDLSAANNAMVVSHQPQIEMLSRDFNNYFCPHHVEVKSFEIDADTTWASLKPQTAKMLAHYKPSIVTG